MKQLFSIALVTLLLMSCSHSQTQNSLSAKAFAEKLKALPEAPVIDVRTAEEFSSGHLQNAVNYDWNGSQFEAQIKTLDKSKPVFVYCLSGGRSAAAASKMRADGFSEVYELEGGMMKWRNENLPETTNDQVSSTGMSEQDFQSLLNSDKTILIDFYADWCIPCKKMEPYLNDISKEQKNTLTLIRINVEENQELCQKLGISAIPVLQVYKNRKMTWTNTGFIEKETVLKALE
ncbi:thioredoxin domain-containing protein [uncultured Fluviicola sp.]|uniref:thioredoxin domain-containing protein n=1 Tax=uncultured Fluviicola sp. TaxID=463303 RepID=UPI0025F03397|nr:thioredoxin domain-containing protein [uncultured Fluviicola sp.]